MKGYLLFVICYLLFVVCMVRVSASPVVERDEVANVVECSYYSRKLWAIGGSVWPRRSNLTSKPAVDRPSRRGVRQASKKDSD